MDKILSARVDESVIQQVGLLAHELKTSKKAVIEAAVRLYSEQIGLEKKLIYLKILVVPGKDQKHPRKAFQKLVQPSMNQWKGIIDESLY